MGTGQLRTQLTKGRKLSDKQKKRAAEKEAALQKEKEKNSSAKSSGVFNAPFVS
ncbi:hypothetical protein G0S15_002778 [Salmonella enterica]|nr:hypothetical protein [Salmonella enterica]